MPARGPLSEEEFLALMAIEATKLERFARELREGKWETFDIDETFTRVNERQEKVTTVIRASRLQALGKGSLEL
jgi:hypothetical protein